MSGLAGENVSLALRTEGFTFLPVCSLLPVCIQDVRSQLATLAAMAPDSRHDRVLYLWNGNPK